MEDLSKIFSISAKDLLNTTEKSEETNFYKPSPDKGIDKVYTSQIIFLPYAKNPSISLIDKWTVWIDDEENGRKINVDCPSTVKKPSLLQDAFFACRNSDNANIRNLQNLFKRKRDLYSLVYIVQDQHQPELEGKIKIFKFGQQIYDILQSAANDQDEPINFLDVLNNKIFKLVVNEVNTGTKPMPNYKLSKFLNKNHKIIINGKEITKKKEDLKIFVNWLKENSPELEPYQYKDWDEETRKIVVNYIKSSIPSNEIVNQILKISNKSQNKSKNEKIKYNSQNSTKSNDNYIEYEENSKSIIKDEDIEDFDDIDDEIDEIYSKKSKDNYDLDDLDDLDDVLNYDEDNE